jgi:hypothetical protein
VAAAASRHKQRASFEDKAAAAAAGASDGAYRPSRAADDDGENGPRGELDIAADLGPFASGATPAVRAIGRYVVKAGDGDRPGETPAPVKSKVSAPAAAAPSTMASADTPAKSARLRRFCPMRLPPNAAASEKFSKKSRRPNPKTGASHQERPTSSHGPFEY